MIVNNTMQGFMDKLKDAVNDPRMTRTPCEHILVTWDGWNAVFTCQNKDCGEKIVLPELAEHFGLTPTM